MPTRIPASERTSQKLDELLTQGVTDARLWLALLALLTAKNLNAAGLFIALAAAVLMAFYPPRVPQFTKEGAPHFILTTDATEETKRKARRQWWRSVVAQGLLVLGFLLQFIALWVP